VKWGDIDLGERGRGEAGNVGGLVERMRSWKFGGHRRAGRPDSYTLNARLQAPVKLRIQH
jgi:hypothetical protein